MKKILITGGAGFIGSEFVRQGVTKGYDIAVVDGLTYAGDMERIRKVEKDIHFYKEDITNMDSIKAVFLKERPDAVIHWAAESHVDRSILNAAEFLETNVKGTMSVLEAARHTGIEKLINISTDEVYGDLDKDGQFYETTPLNPSSPYSVSKASADMLGRAYHRTHGLPIVTVRPSNNYGPWQYPEKLLPVVIVKALNNEKIPVYGKGENVREWLFVADCASAVFNILENGSAGGIYNVGSGEEKRNIDVVKNILKILGKPEELISFVKDRPGHDFRYSLNSDKIRKELAWNTGTHFNKGLEETIKWYVDNMEWVNGKLRILKEYWAKIYK